MLVQAIEQECTHGQQALINSVSQGKKTLPVIIMSAASIGLDRQDSGGRDPTRGRPLSSACLNQLGKHLFRVRFALVQGGLEMNKSGDDSGLCWH